jgi:hypothetical protein
MPEQQMTGERPTGSIATVIVPAQGRQVKVWKRRN